MATSSKFDSTTKLHFPSEPAEDGNLERISEIHLSIDNVVVFGKLTVDPFELLKTSFAMIDFLIAANTCTTSFQLQYWPCTSKCCHIQQRF